MPCWSLLLVWCSPAVSGWPVWRWRWLVHACVFWTVCSWTVRTVGRGAPLLAAAGVVNRMFTSVCVSNVLCVWLWLGGCVPV